MQRVIIKDEHGHTFVEIPVTISALVAKFKIEVERSEPKAGEWRLENGIAAFHGGPLFCGMYLFGSFEPIALGNVFEVGTMFST
ncbi:MAG: hypothetical protein M3Y07_13850 [Acidobacteriota bacterium]|nr:hypothetical protein [Acidobacteriota bacterium]